MKKSPQKIVSSATMFVVGLSINISALTAADKPEVTPFIKSQYFNQNISLATFRSNPREFFRSEAAFNLLVTYVESEVGRPISNAEFIALMNSDQVRARKCPQSETIRVGGLEENQFYWFSRSCRPGEEIVQLRLADRWLDVFSLACLNAKEDTTPVPPPVLAAVPPEPKSTTLPVEPIQRRNFSDVVRSNPYVLPGFIGWGNSHGHCNSCSGHGEIGSGPFIGNGYIMGDTIESRGYTRTGEYYNEY